MSFRTFRAAVEAAIPSAGFDEIDDQYRAGVTSKEAVAAIRLRRKNAKLARQRRSDFEGSDFDYSMNA
jgi:hypothetical protein